MGKMKFFVLMTIWLPFCAIAQKNGMVQEFTPEGAVIENTYKKDVLEGKSKTYYKGSENVHIEGTYKKGKKEGIWQYYKYPAEGGKYVYQSFRFENDTLNGPFMQIENGEMITGKYKGGELSGDYAKHKIEVAGGDTLLIPIERGLYLNGKIDSEWQYYEKGVLAREGKYVDEQKEFVWKEYGLHSTPHKVMIETRYKDGKKDGKEIEYFSYECISEKCPQPDSKGCCAYKKIDVYKEYIYNKGVLYGNYVAKQNTADGKIIEKGEYVEGEKVGEWFEVGDDGTQITANYFNGNRAGPITIKTAEGKLIATGSYNNGIKNGEWIHYDEEGKKKYSENYNNGVLEGDAWLFSNGTKTAQAKIEKGKMYKYMMLNSAGEVVQEYEIEHNTPKKEWIHVQHMFIENDTVYYYNYNIKPNKELGFQTWEKDFSEWKTKGGTDFVKAGSYEKIYNDVTLVYGEYSDNLKDGIWEFDYGNKAIWKQTYSLGKLKSEEFLSMGKEKLDDDYIVNYKNGNPRFEFKVKEGLRNGKSRYYDEKGNEIKEEKYKEGVKD